MTVSILPLKYFFSHVLRTQRGFYGTLFHIMLSSPCNTLHFATKQPMAIGRLPPPFSQYYWNKSRFICTWMAAKPLNNLQSQVKPLNYHCQLVLLWLDSLVTRITSSISAFSVEIHMENVWGLSAGKKIMKVINWPEDYWVLVWISVLT